MSERGRGDMAGQKTVLSVSAARCAGIGGGGRVEQGVHTSRCGQVGWSGVGWLIGVRRVT